MSASFAGLLRVELAISDQGTGVLTAWCSMATAPKPYGRVSDGISLTGGPFCYTNSTKSEQRLEGVMF